MIIYFAENYELIVLIKGYLICSELYYNRFAELN